jgi:acetyl-CoA carboxylase biotin carboxyl carrier protein
LDLKELKDILLILDERNIAEFELEEKGVKLRVLRIRGEMPPHPTPVVASVMTAGSAVPALGAGASTAAGSAAPSAAPGGESALEEGLHVIKSPIVGTFYRAPDPNSPVFCEVGDRVKSGQVVCIIEAMKLMNEIESEVAGEIVKIHVENGKPVQYGDPLFSIRQA